MDVRHLELLRDLADRGTLAAVAHATHRTPSAVSQQLRTAERELGVRLVEPAGRGLRLTPEGELLAAGAGEVAEVIARVRGRLDELVGAPAGTVSIGTLPSAGQALLPGLLRRLAETRIQLALDDFDLPEAEFATRARDVDVVVAHSLVPGATRVEDGLVRRVLAREPIDVAVPAAHPLAERPVLRPADLAGTTWVGVPSGYPFDTVMGSIERELGAPLERRYRLRDNGLVQALVAGGAGLGLLPRFTTRAVPGVVIRPLVGVRAHRSIVALSRPERHERLAVRTVVDLLVEVGHGLAQARGEAATPEG
ncbi:LysR family transcriptional regulator [Arsenicicoccus sp. oral taxon 190]|uniref:LysR family transcriptional regulator n=1 Tax=Arsenicicoccus sp. oral taxon 190 TaxID=1658671 RepID=UPI000679FABC|nr:LysR family transcriptional regulator [Arsenicicoccus sp. oral taxon 190]AKT52191.1 transcriptional regulator [Arsenicicoccus sp. oral taxon 190]